MSPRVLFIAGLTHSGSTLLDILVGRHPDVVGLGEIRLLLRSSKLYEDDRRCTCGELVSACPFWSVVRARLLEADPVDTVARYRVVLEIFAGMFGSTAWLADSSKNRTALADVLASGAEVRVLHLARDVRGWIVSRHDRGGRLGRRSALSLAATWYRGNRAIERYLEDQQVPHLPVLYDELCLHPRREMDRIFRFMGVEPPPDDAAEPRHHVALGNPRLRRSGSHDVRYDDRWFHRSSWVLPWLALPRVRSYNRKWYERVRGGE